MRPIATVVPGDLGVPTRPYSCITMAEATYARKLGLTLHYDTRPISPPQAAELLEMYLSRLRASMAD